MFVLLGFFKKHDLLGKLEPTGASMDQLIDLGNKFSTPPPNFNLHNGMYKLVFLSVRVLCVLTQVT